MFFSEGQSCPVCKKTFQKDDDIVVCPHCGAPHHRSCYHEIGHCYYEEAHGTADQWSREKAEKTENAEKRNSDFTTKRCPHCGFDNPSLAEFCGHCGRPVEPDTVHNPPPQKSDTFREFTFVPFRAPVQDTGGVDPDRSIDGERAADVAQAIGTNQMYYMPVFENFEKTGNKVKWNWAAFLFGPYWLLFRKCHLTGALMLVFSILQDAVTLFVVKKLNLQTTMDLFSYLLKGNVSEKYQLILLAVSMISLALSIFFGLFGNAIYEHACLKRVRAHKDTVGSDPAALTLSGGISIGLPIYAFFLSELALYLFELFF